MCGKGYGFFKSVNQRSEVLMRRVAVIAVGPLGGGNKAKTLVTSDSFPLMAAPIRQYASLDLVVATGRLPGRMIVAAASHSAFAC